MADVIGLVRRLSCSQLDGWYAFYCVSPWGPMIENFRAGQLCSAVYNSGGRYKKHWQPADFSVQLR